MKILGIAFIVMTSGSSVLSQSGGCPQVRAVPNFNIKDIIGTWYEVARYSDMTIEKSANASSVTVDILKNGTIYYNVTNIINGEANGFHGLLDIAPDANGRGVLQYKVETNAGTHEPDLHLNVLDLNPKKYIILYDCRYDEKLKKRSEISWVSARDPHVHQDIEDAINAFSTIAHILDNSKLLWERPSDHLVV